MARQRSTKLSGRSKTILPDYKVNVWEGLNTYIKDLKELSDGQSPDSLNWLTGKFKDHIELRRGYALLGTNRVAGAGRVTGLGIGTRYDGTQIPFFSYGRKLNYYNIATDTTIEIGTNTLPAAASTDDVSILPYQNIAGSWVYWTSPNSSWYKTPVANPASITDQYKTAFRGTAKFGQSRTFLWNRKDAYGQSYPNQLYLGVSDKTVVTQYTQTTKVNVGTGDGATKAFTGTLSLSQLQAAPSNQSCFYTEFAAPVDAGVNITGISKASQAVVTVAAHTLAIGDAVLINAVVGMTEINNLIGIVQSTTATTITLNIDSTSFTAWSSAGKIYKAEYFIDDNNGNLTSSLGGTGTINYATGAFALAFNTAPTNAQNIYSQFYQEDATNLGVMDFTIDGATKGKGKVFTQGDGGGPIVGVFPFDQVEYCFHQLKSWYLSLGSDDTAASNLPYRSNLGIPYFRAGYPTDDGIIYLDNSNPNQPKIQILEIDNNSATAVITVVPAPLSEGLDLSGLGFTKAVMFRWGDYDIMACSGQLNGITQNFNTQMFVRNIYSKQWDLLDYSVSSLAKYNGTLLSGDALTSNIFTLFSGFDDDGTLINNHWNSKLYNLGVEGLKKFNRFTIRGLIQQNQNIDIYFSFDNGNFVKLATVQGNASYVNTGNPTNVGSNTVGSTIVGGGGDAVTAYPFEVEFTVSSDIFEYIQLQFQASNIGYAQIDEFTFKDVRYKGRHLTPARTIVY